MKRLLTAIAIAATMLAPATAFAQDEVEATVGADLVSSYLWRGFNLSSGAVQPSLGISWKGLSFGAWGSYGVINPADNKELDLALSYSIKGLTIGVSDYFIAGGSGDCPAKYFDYSDGTTLHVLEGAIGYDFGFLSANWYTNFFNDDDYASYFELTVPFKLGVDWEFNAGFAPYASAYYANDGFACTCLSLKASKEIGITDKFSLPVFGQLAANPNDGKMYLAFGVSIGL